MISAPRRFKPNNAAKASDYEVRKVKHAEASVFIKQHHYAKGCSLTSTEAFGLFRTGLLVGAALWMPPTKVCAESVDKAEWKKVLSLSRLAVLEGEPKNVASLFIGAMLRTLRREGRWVALVTFADESQGHTGAIYKATNWRYLGRTKPAPRWVDAQGRQVSVKATKSRTVSEMQKLGYRIEGRFSKHKFVFRLKGQ